jgi:predicted Ser/Thr protein kinase
MSMIGKTLGPYEITSRLGAGGMGEVYRARDPRVGRKVAIKVSAERFNERFEREARAVAALNHPNICTLYDVGPDYIVMELVEGKTLEDRIKQCAIPLEEALTVARQIPDALEAAHEKRIIHRDLKPGNIKIRPDGTVKVLDFGLAKQSRDREGADIENSPTLSIVATQQGIILGTAGYMSPEQARGKPVDKRTDMWAFGVILYEMLPGNRLFEGETVSDTLAAVLAREPEWDKVPAKARHLLRSCLQKDPKQRLADISDGKLLLEAAPGAIPEKPSRLAWGIAAIFVMATIAVSFLYLRGKTGATAQVARFEIPPGETLTGAAPLQYRPTGAIWRSHRKTPMGSFACGFARWIPSKLGFFRGRKARTSRFSSGHRTAAISHSMPGESSRRSISPEVRLRLFAIYPQKHWVVHGAAAV